MREILFRGKRIDNGEWEIGSLDIHPDGKFLIANKCKNPPDGDPMWRKVVITHEVDKTTIGQYTGLTDKSGNKIWENDIVLVAENVYSAVKFGLYHEASKSERTHQGFYLESMDNYYYREELGYWVKESVVVGNIFDNPELLQEESE